MGLHIRSDQQSWVYTNTQFTLISPELTHQRHRIHGVWGFLEAYSLPDCSVVHPQNPLVPEA